MAEHSAAQPPVPFDGERDVRERFAATAWPLMRNVYGAALRMCGQREVAEDVTQETFLRAFRTFASFIEGTDCKAWLFTIMRSVIINRYKYQQRRPETPLETMSSEADVLAVRDPALVALVEHASHAEVESALAALPDDYRAVVVLVDIEEFSYEEAARAIECPVGTVRSRLSRARRQLAVTLQEHARRSGYGFPSERRS